MKNFIFIMFQSIFFVYGCMQSRVAVKAYSYFQHINYGTIAVDDKGNQLTPGSNIARSIFLESNSNYKPVINEVIYNDSGYKNLSVSSVGEKELVIGVRRSDNTKINLSPEKGNTLWRIEFTTPENQAQESKKSEKSVVIIKGVINQKSFKLNIDNEIELKPFMGM